MSTFFEFLIVHRKPFPVNYFRAISYYLIIKLASKCHCPWVFSDYEQCTRTSYTLYSINNRKLLTESDQSLSLYTSSSVQIYYLWVHFNFFIASNDCENVQPKSQIHKGFKNRYNKLCEVFELLSMTNKKLPARFYSLRILNDSILQFHKHLQ